jgi:hypothetical protein
MPSVKSSSAKRTAFRARPAKAASRATAQLPALDQDALDALDFTERGCPDAEIGYSKEAPRLTRKQLSEFEPASFRFTRRK